MRLPNSTSRSISIVICFNRDSRSGTDPAAMVVYEQRAAYLKADGSIADMTKATAVWSDPLNNFFNTTITDQTSPLQLTTLKHLVSRLIY